MTPMHQLLNDPIDVTVEFNGKHVHPKHVRWGRHDYDMSSVNLIHGTKEGTRRVYYFSVSDRSNFMKLRLDTETLEWRLVEIYTD